MRLHRINVRWETLGIATDNRLQCLFGLISPDERASLDFSVAIHLST